MNPKVFLIIIAFFLCDSSQFAQAQNTSSSTYNTEETAQETASAVTTSGEESASTHTEAGESASVKVDESFTTFKMPENVDELTGLANRFWMVIAALLVFFMQAGFKVFEVGLVRKIDGNAVGFKNLMDWLVVTLVFMFLGFGLMFGTSNGVFGTPFSISNLTDGSMTTKDGVGYEYFLFQLAFAATAATIVSGALAVRIRLISYIILAGITGGLIYPVFGHWVWGASLIDGGAEPWLASIGFIDFAGSTVVHSTGAWIALTGMWYIRPRIGKINRKQNKVEIIVQNDELEKFKPHNLGYSVLGVLILWIGWWGFNGGSESLIGGKYDVPTIILNTNLAGVAGGIAAFCYCLWFQEKRALYEKSLGGVLGGLVAITACCNLVTPMTAIFIGLLAGVVHNITYDRLNDKTVFGRIIDDPVGAIPVHGACGILGTLCVVLGNYTAETGHTLFQQLGIQIFGIAVCATFTILASILVFTVLHRTIGLEISPSQEKKGETI